MNQLFNWLKANPQALVIFLVALFSVLGTVVKQIQEKKEARRIQQERERRKRDALRTGRVEPAASPPSPAANPEAARQRRLQELAERRRAQLEEIRRRQQATPAPPPAPATRPTPIARTGAPVRPRPQAPARPMPAPARPAPRPQAPVARTPVQRQQPTRAPVARQAPARVARPTAPVSKQPGARQRPPARATAATTAPITRTEVGAVPTATPRARSSVGSRLFSGRSDLRRAIVLSEVLGPPVSLRG